MSDTRFQISDTALLITHQHHSSLSNDSGALRYLSWRRHSWDWISWSHLAHHRVHGSLDVVEKWFGIDTNPKRQDDEWRHVDPLPSVKIRQFFVFRIIDSTEKHSLIK